MSLTEFLLMLILFELMGLGAMTRKYLVNRRGKRLMWVLIFAVGGMLYALLRT
jgi:hypothetical protein